MKFIFKFNVIVLIISFVLEDDDVTNAKGPTERAKNVRRDVPLVPQPDGVGDAEVSPATRVTRAEAEGTPRQAL